MKSDIRDLRDEVAAGFGKVETRFIDVRRSIAQLSVAMEKAYGRLSVATMETRVWGLVTLGGILLLVARELKWI